MSAADRRASDRRRGGRFSGFRIRFSYGRARGPAGTCRAAGEESTRRSGRAPAVRPRSVSAKCRGSTTRRYSEGGPRSSEPHRGAGAFRSWRRAVSTPRRSSTTSSRIPNSTTVRSSPRARRRQQLERLRAPRGHGDGTRLGHGMSNVPSVTGETNTHTCWRTGYGLNGDGVSDLVQAGTEQEKLYNFAFPWFSLSISVYYAWTEFLPQQATSNRSPTTRSTPATRSSARDMDRERQVRPTLFRRVRSAAARSLARRSRPRSTHRSTRPSSRSEAVWIIERPSLGTP